MSPGKPAGKTDSDPKMISLVSNPGAVIWFCLFALMLVVAGFFYYTSESRRIREVNASELSTIGQVKAEQIRRWRMERVGDAMRIANSPAIKKLMAEWLLDPDRKTDQEELMSRLQLEKDLGIYFQALLVDADQRILLCPGPQPPEMETDSWAAVKKSLTEKGPVLSELHYTTLSHRIHIDIATAIRDAAGKLLAVLVLTTDAREFLFPMIQFWPTSSPSGETLLVRRDGDEVVFLNELKYRKNTALKLRFPVSNISLPAAQAVLGRTGVFYGRDYSGTKVIADLRPIPGTHWYLVAKESQAEVEEEVRFHAFWVFGTVLVLILCVAGAMTAWNKTLQIGERKRVEVLLRDSEARYRRLFETAKDGILILDAVTGMIVDVNPYLVQLLGYSKDQFIKKRVWEIGSFKDILANQDHFLNLQKEKYVRYEDRPLETADGRKIDVEFVSNVYKVDHHEVIQCNIRDVTERKRAEALLRESESKFRILFEEGMDGILLANPKTKKFTLPNTQICRMLGYSAEEFKNLTILDLHPARDLPRVMEIFEKMVRGETTLAPGLPILRKDGTVFYADIAAKTVDLGGETWLVGIFRDVSERKRLERELMQAKELQFKTLMDSLPSKVFLKDRNSVYVSCNQNYAKDLEIQPEEIVGKTDYDFFPTPLAEKYREEDKQIMESGMTENREEEYHGIRDYLAGSQKSYINIVKVPVRDGSGNVTGLLSFFWDITKRKRTEQELKESKELVEAVVENVPLMIFLKEAKDLRFVVFNRAGEELLGYDRKALLGRNNLDLFPPEQAAFFAAKDREVLQKENGMIDIPEETILTAKKGQRLLHTRKVCIRGADGVTKYLLGISEDITEQKILEAEKNRVEVLAAAAEAKTKFTPMISHELRSPIAVILGALEIALEGLAGEVNNELKEVLEIAKKNSERLISLIGNVLDFQKIESGKMEYNIFENDLREVTEEIRVSMGVLTKAKGLDLRVELEEGLPKIKFDRDKLIQVITNLVNNAIHHTQSGGITLTAQKEKDVVHVKVQDTGEGIPPLEISKLFQPFEQVGGLGSRQKGGTGLGLAISREIILAHHGKIWAESIIGKGSSFHFTLPL
jgi:PAS domain S-box-containing protein